MVSVSAPPRFRLSYFLDPGLLLVMGDYCMVPTECGLEFCRVVSHAIPKSITQTLQDLKPITRKATEEDLQNHLKNVELEQQAHQLCIKKIKARNLPMKLVQVKFFFDRSKAIFYFTADGRVDFRELVFRDLAYEFRTRIEMRQIGVRDEAKMIGGYGCCGLSLCCSTFLRDFEPVSIRMAKEQNLTLIPTKISGLCGRLMCCLNYEFETYREIKKQFPKVGKKVMTTQGEGKVCRVNIIRETVVVEIPDRGIVELDKERNHQKEQCSRTTSNQEEKHGRQTE